MKGEEVKDKLLANGYVLSDIAQTMSITPQALHKLLMAEDIKTGVLERIAKAIDKNIMFFFDMDSDKSEDIRITNEIVNNRRQLAFLYQKIVDVAILNKDYLKISETLETQDAAEIYNNFIFPEPKFRENIEGDLELEIVKWQNFNIDKKKLYNAELSESVRLLQDMFFEQFRLLYKKIRKFE